MSKEQYYYKDAQKKDVGPFHLDELKEKMTSGEISPDTYVINTSDMQWRRLRELSGAGLPPINADLPAPFLSSLMDKILKANGKISMLLSKTTTFGRYEPKNTDELYLFLNRLQGAQSLIIWVSCILLGYKILEDDNILAGILGGAVAGFILQFLCYLFSSANIKMVCGRKIVMSSMLIPEVTGIICLISTVLCLFGALGAAFAVGQFDMDYGHAVYLLLAGIICYTAALFSFKCKIFFVNEEKNAVAGREIVSIMRYAIRLICLVAQISATLTGPFVMLAVLVSGDRVSISLDWEDMFIYLVAIILPVANYFLFIAGSFLPDLLDCMFREDGERKN